MKMILADAYFTVLEWNGTTARAHVQFVASGKQVHPLPQQMVPKPHNQQTVSGRAVDARPGCDAFVADCGGNSVVNGPRQAVLLDIGKQKLQAALKLHLDNELSRRRHDEL